MASEPILVALDEAVIKRSGPGPSVIADYWMLTKPEVNFLIGMTTVTAFCVGSRVSLPHFPWMMLFNTLLGTVLVASGAATLNQLIERRFDAQMRRTAGRPLVAGRIEPRSALIFGILLSMVGLLLLALTTSVAASVLALITLAGYLFAYTPLKRRTPLCTFIGAFAGAMPVLIAYAAVAGRLNAEAWQLYAILFLWQFPHFMAIAWMYRDDYARAGYKVLPSGIEKSRLMKWQSVLPAAALVPVTVVALILRQAGPVFVIGILLLGLAFLFSAVRLAVVRSNRSARELLLSSVVYLPLVFVLEVLARM